MPKDSSNTKSELRKLQVRSMNTETSFISNRALKAVIYCSETKLTAEEFLEQVKYLNIKDYDGIPEERATNNICGYVFCDNKLQHANKDFKICNKKVIDLRKTEFFCSRRCQSMAKTLKARSYRLYNE